MRRALALVMVLAACAGAAEDDAIEPDGAPGGVVTTGSAGDRPSSTIAADGGGPTTTNERADVVATPAEPGRSPQGFELVAARVTAVDGTVCDVCLWLADEPDLRRRGLMSVTDLGAGDGMAFVYPEPHTGSFWMKDTVLALSIAFFAPDGAFLDRFDMEPCAAEPCPSYPTPADFTIAVETERGRAAQLGIGPGATLVLLGPGCGAG